MNTNQEMELFRRAFGGRAMAIISMDTEQIWGHMDVCTQDGFSRRYPNAMSMAERLLSLLCL